ncbi:MAG: sigma factor, partial [Gammaproteobacteria bacterium]
MRLGVSLKTVPATVHNADRLAFETALLLRIRDAQDTSAFDTLFNALAAKMLGYLVRSGGCSAGDGENLLQDVWLTVWTKAHLFDPERASARTWIFALARHAMIDLKRVRGREQQAFELYALEH